MPPPAWLAKAMRPPGWRGVADNAIAGLAPIRADFPAASEAGLLVLYLLAQASWLRHTGSDLDDRSAT